MDRSLGPEPNTYIYEKKNGQIISTNLMTAPPVTTLIHKLTYIVFKFIIFKCYFVI